MCWVLVFAVFAVFLPGLRICRVHCLNLEFAVFLLGLEFSVCLLVFRVCRVLACSGVLRAGPFDEGRGLRGRHCAVHGGWNHPPLPCASNHTGHGWVRESVLLMHVSTHVHGGRQRDGGARWGPSPRPGVRSVPSHWCVDSIPLVGTFHLHIKL